VRVNKNGVLWSTYLYDGDGAMVVKTEDGKTTLYIGNLLEIEMTGGGTPSTPTVIRTPSNTRTPTNTGGTPSAPTASSTPSNIPTRTLTRTDSTTKTSTPTPTVFNGTGLFAEYFNDKNLIQLVTSQVDPLVSFGWGTGRPSVLTHDDDFSVRWTGWVRPLFTGAYTFYVNSDDGAKLWVNDQLIINAWTSGGSEKTSSPIQLTAGGWYMIKLEYYEDTGSAYVHLKWSSSQQKKDVIQPNNLKPCAFGMGGHCPTAPTPTNTLTPTPTITYTPTLSPTLGLDASNGLTGRYYGNSTFTGLLYTKVDRTVNFDWGAGSPAGVPANFSVKWSGYIEPQYSETYWICLEHANNDAESITVNGQVIASSDYWEAGEICGSIALTAGVKYSILVTYADGLNNARAKLRWHSPSRSKQIIPNYRLFPETPAPTPTGTPAGGTGLTGEYFTGTNFTGLAYTQTDRSRRELQLGSGKPGGLTGEFLCTLERVRASAIFRDLYFLPGTRQ
jgi:hypothetical protein